MERESASPYRLYSCLSAFLAEMIRMTVSLLSSFRTVCETVSKIRLPENPIARTRNSPSTYLSSSSTRFGSSKTASASSKPIPCFRLLIQFFLRVPFKPLHIVPVATKMVLQNTVLLTQHPGILTPPTLRRVHHQRPTLQRHTSQPTRHNRHLIAVKHIRPQIHMPRLQAHPQSNKAHAKTRS